MLDVEDSEQVDGLHQNVLKRTPAARWGEPGDFGGIDSTPRHALTMGVRSILDARRVVLMAWGQHKAEIVQLEEVLQGYSSLLHDVTQDRDRFRDDWKAMTQELSRWRK